MADLILDSDVVIWHLRGRPVVTEFILALASRLRLGISAVSRAEVMAGARLSEESGTLRFLDACQTIEVNADIADMAGRLVRNQRADGITMHLPDALIAASALVCHVPLYTCNPRHYIVDGLEVRSVAH
jgi:predicted nucleic acid-binding protein